MTSSSIAESVGVVNADLDALAVLADPACPVCHGAGYVERMTMIERLGECFAWPTGELVACTCVRRSAC